VPIVARDDSRAQAPVREGFSVGSSFHFSFFLEINLSFSTLCRMIPQGLTCLRKSQPVWVDFSGYVRYGTGFAGCSSCAWWQDEAIRAKGRADTAKQLFRRAQLPDVKLSGLPPFPGELR